jgi:hypothetical protein
MIRSRLGAALDALLGGLRRKVRGTRGGGDGPKEEQLIK